MINHLKNKGFLTIAGAALLCGAVAFTPIKPVSAAESAFTDAQKVELDKLMEAYLMENGKTILDAVTAHQQQEEAKQNEAAAEALGNLLPKLLENNPPSAGNPNGDITVVEFFDYNCGYCKRAVPDIQQAINEDGNVHFIFKEMPILGPPSKTAAQWALAAHQQGKYFEYHVALMDHKGQKTEGELTKLAEKLGLDVAKMKKDASSEAVAKQIEEDIAAARALGISGTPAFIIDGDLRRGYLGEGGIKQAVEAARKN